MRTLVAAVVLVGALGGAAVADPLPPQEPRRALVVGVKPAPPFAVQAPDGTWSGLAVDLARMAATDLGVQITMQSFEYVPALIDAVQSGQVDLGVGALTITPERAQKVTFTRPFHASGLAIAAAPSPPAGPIHALRHLLHWHFLAFVAALLALGAAAAVVARRRPRARAALAVTWGAVAVLVTAATTAAVTARATALEIAARIDSPDDLNHARVATIPGTTSAAYLDARGLTYRPVANAGEALRLLDRGAIDAVVYDEPVLRKLAAARLIPGLFERQTYAFALPPSSPLRADLDRALEARLASPAWQTLLDQYLK
ncbi:MAG TPA: transporter substrate-binding domain-containing protein [Kofleriaceae bacterium]|nr:transporter substrate-binding domain-containing protein [Kofleriaceae bacterium]